MEFGLWIYPWDLLDGGVEPVVGRLADLGVNSLSVTTVYHEGRFLLPKRSVRKTFSTTPGVAYFAPRADSYEAGWVPKEDREAVQAELFPRLRAACTENGLQLRAWTIGLHDHPRPGRKVVNVFGDEYGFALCPSVAENRHYLTCLVRDVASRGWFDVIDLESYGYHGYRHQYLHHERDALSLGSLELYLLSLCFCDSCRAAAAGRGVDVEGARAAAISFLEGRLQHEGPGEGSHGLWQLTSFMVNHPEVYGYTRSAMANVAETLAQVRTALQVGGPALGVTSATFLQPAAAMWQEGLGLEPGLWSLVDRLIVLAYFRDPKDLYDELNYVLDSTGRRPERLVVGQSLFPSESPSLDNALSKVRVARELGIEKLCFYNYGFLPEKRIGWLAAIGRAME